MADQATERELLDEVLQGAQAMGTLAGNEETFRAVLDAFRAQDGESMNLLLERHKLAERCEVVCHWLRSKEAVLLCLWLAGPPPLEQEPPDIRAFAEVVARVTADEEAVELLAQAVQERDQAAWRELIEKHQLQPFSHLLCHWVCTIFYRLVCEVVCTPIRIPRPELIPELQTAGQAVRALAADETAFAAAAKAAVAGSCETLSSTLGDAGFAPFCLRICEWFCSWRCVLLCLRLCRIFPLEAPASEIEEELEFARALGVLRTKNGALQRLTAAVLREDVETMQTLVKELEFGRFCIQFCHWVCFLRCLHFCICVCPPATIAVFTKIGGLYYDTAINSHAPGNGLTIADSRAFYSTLRLNGGFSLVNGAPLIEYRFETTETAADGSTPPTPTWDGVGKSAIQPTNIGSFINGLPFPFNETIEVWVNNPAAAPPGAFNIDPASDGWIKVPPLSPSPPMVPGPGWRFVPGSDLIRFDTTTLTDSVVAIDESGVTAGSSANPASLQTDVHYGVRMRIRNQGATTDGTDAGTCSHIAINNSVYNNISHHPYWPGGLFNAHNELGVASLGIAELAAAPCSLLTSSFTVQFTGAHSNLGDVSLVLEGPGGPYSFTLNPATPEDAGENWYGTADPHLDGSTPPQPWTFGSLSPCAYLLNLYVTLLLTTGDSNPDALHDYIAFCKGPS
jgi:hypothetical protein